MWLVGRVLAIRDHHRLRRIFEKIRLTADLCLEYNKNEPRRFGAFCISPGPNDPPLGILQVRDLKLVLDCQIG